MKQQAYKDYVKAAAEMAKTDKEVIKLITSAKEKTLFRRSKGLIKI